MTINWLKKYNRNAEESFNWKAVIVMLLLFTLFIGVQLYFLVEYMING